MMPKLISFATLLAGALLLVSAPGHASAGSTDEDSIPPENGARPFLACSLEVIAPLRPPASQTAFAPESVALDELGRLFVLDRASGRIVRYTRDGTWVQFGAGDQGGVRYPNLTSLYARSGPDLFALAPAAGTLYQFDLDGRLRQTVSYQDGLDRANLGFVNVVDFALDRAGQLLLLDRSGGRLLLFDRFGRFLTDLASGATSADRPQSPVRLALDDEGQIFLCDPPGNWIRRFTPQGTPRPAWRYLPADSSAAGGAPLLCVTPWNQAVVVSRSGAFARLFTPDGRLQLIWRNPKPGIGPVSSVAAGPDSVIYLSCPGRGEIERWKWVVRDRGATRSP